MPKRTIERGIAAYDAWERRRTAPELHGGSVVTVRNATARAVERGAIIHSIRTGDREQGPAVPVELYTEPAARAKLGRALQQLAIRIGTDAANELLSRITARAAAMPLS